MTPEALRIGTRGSLLATTQASYVAQKLAESGHCAEMLIIKTEGDISAAPVEHIGIGVFTTALRIALQNYEIDVAVHSYKDLPTAPHDGLVIAAVPKREDARDALVSSGNRMLNELPVGATVGTSAPRRIAQLRALGLSLEIRPLRGNLDSRLGKVTNGELDAVVVARAGLIRIGRTEEVAEAFDPVVLLPAPGQGALAVECRADDAQLVSTLSTLDDPYSRATVDAERALLSALEAGCTAPVGAYAEVVESIDAESRISIELSLSAAVAAVDGSDVIRSSTVGSVAQAAAVGRALASEMLESGAALLLS